MQPKYIGGAVWLVIFIAFVIHLLWTEPSEKFWSACWKHVRKWLPLGFIGSVGFEDTKK